MSDYLKEFYKNYLSPAMDWGVRVTEPLAASSKLLGIGLRTAGQAFSPTLNREKYLEDIQEEEFNPFTTERLQPDLSGLQFTKKGAKEYAQEANKGPVTPVAFDPFGDDVRAEQHGETVMSGVMPVVDEAAKTIGIDTDTREYQAARAVGKAAGEFGISVFTDPLFAGAATRAVTRGSRRALQILDRGEGFIAAPAVGRGAVEGSMAAQEAISQGYHPLDPEVIEPATQAALSAAMGGMIARDATKKLPDAEPGAPQRVGVSAEITEDMEARLGELGWQPGEVSDPVTATQIINEKYAKPTMVAPEVPADVAGPVPPVGEVDAEAELEPDLQVRQQETPDIPQQEVDAHLKKLAEEDVEPAPGVLPRGGKIFVGDSKDLLEPTESEIERFRTKDVGAELDAAFEDIAEKRPARIRDNFTKLRELRKADRLSPDETRAIQRGFKAEDLEPLSPADIKKIVKAGINADQEAKWLSADQVVFMKLGPETVVPAIQSATGTSDQVDFLSGGAFNETYRSTPQSGPFAGKEVIYRVSKYALDNPEYPAIGADILREPWMVKQLGQSAVDIDGKPHNLDIMEPLKTWKESGKGVARFAIDLHDLNQKIRKSGFPVVDLHAGNAMYRGDELVVSDPGAVVPKNWGGDPRHFAVRMPDGSKGVSMQATQLASRVSFPQEKKARIAAKTLARVYKRNWSKKLVDKLFKPERLPHSARNVASAIKWDAESNKWTHYVGMFARNEDDIALLAMTNRAPFEIGQVVGVKDGEVKQIAGFSVGASDAASFDSKFLQQAQRLVDLGDLDGFYLVHNHPFTDVNSSEADKGANLQALRHFKGYKGAIIINHDKYSWTPRDAVDSEERNVPRTDPDPLRPQGPLGTLKNVVARRTMLLKGGKPKDSQFALLENDEDGIVEVLSKLGEAENSLIFYNYRGEVNSVGSVSSQDLLDDPQAVREWIKQQSALNASQRAILVTNSHILDPSQLGDLDQAVGSLTESGVVNAAYDIDPAGGLRDLGLDATQLVTGQAGFQRTATEARFPEEAEQKAIAVADESDPGELYDLRVEQNRRGSSKPINVNWNQPAEKIVDEILAADAAKPPDYELHPTEAEMSLTRAYIAIPEDSKPGGANDISPNMARQFSDLPEYQRREMADFAKDYNSQLKRSKRQRMDPTSILRMAEKYSEGQDLNDIMKKLRTRAGGLTAAEFVLTHDFLTQKWENAGKLKEKYFTEAMLPNTTKEQQAKMWEEYAAANAEAKLWSMWWFDQKAEVGRALRILRDVGNVYPGIADNPESRLAAALRRDGRIDKEAIPDLINLWKEDPQKFAQALRTLLEPGAMDKFVEYRNAGLLWSPATHMVNVTSQGLFMGMRGFIKGVVTPGVEAVVTLGGTRRRRKRFFSESTAMLGGLKTALLGDGEKAGVVLQGLRDVRSILTLKDIDKTVKSFDPTRGSASKLDLYPGAIKGKKGDFIRISFKLLEAADSMFKGASAQMTSAAIAHRRARLEGLTGQELAHRIAEIQTTYKKGFDSPVELSEADWSWVAQDLSTIEKEALRDTFQSELGRMGKATQEVLKENPSLRLIVPFFKTPVNILKESGRLTPANLVMQIGGLSKAMRAGKLDAGDVADRLAMPILGTLVSTALLMAMDDIYDDDPNSQFAITGGGPPDLREQMNKRDTGWQPYSIKIGGTYYDYSRIEPASSLLGIAADGIEAFRDKRYSDADKMTVKLFQTVTENFLSKTFLQGVEGLFMMLKDPGRYGSSYLRNFIGSTVPLSGGTRWVTRVTDPTVRQLDLSDASTLLPVPLHAPFFGNMPGLSRRFPARTKSTGEPWVREFPLIPLQVSTVKAAPL